MMRHSAVMMGAAFDAAVAVGLAKQMAPMLMSEIPLEALDAVYTRWLRDAGRDAHRRGQMVTGHDLLYTWHTIQAELEAQSALEHERAERAYREAMMREIQAAPRAVRHISELAAEDGVKLPWRTSKPPPQPSTPLAPGEPERPQEARSEGDSTDGSHSSPQADTAALRTTEGTAFLTPSQAAQLARAAHNRETFHRMSADRHKRLVDKTDKAVEALREDTGGPA